MENARLSTRFRDVAQRVCAWEGLFLDDLAGAGLDADKWIRSAEPGTIRRV